MPAKTLSQLRLATPLATEISDKPGERIAVYRHHGVGAHCRPARSRTPDRNDHFEESARKDGIRDENRAGTEHGSGLRQDSIRCGQGRWKKLPFEYGGEVI